MFTMRPARVLMVWVLLGLPASVVAQETTRVTGVVIDGADAATGMPIADARVESGVEVVATGEDGRFSVRVRAGERTLMFRADGYLETTVSVEGADIVVRLFRNTFAETVEVVSETTAPQQPSSTPVSPEEVFQVPGSVDNVFRTLALLPGVSSTDDFGSRLAVRGGTPDQNLTVMDGVEIHNPYRLFGITSAFNPETVENFQLTAGGFGVAYGDRLSSLLIIENRSGRPDFQGTTAVSITDGNIVLEGRTPFWDNGTWLFSARRTYYDLVVSPLLDQKFPSFRDLQLQAGWEFGAGHQFTLTGLGSVENADLDFDADRPGERITFGSDVNNDLVSARLDAVLGARGTSTTVVSWYRNRESFDFDGMIRADAKRSNSPEDDVAFGFATIAFDRLISVRDLSMRQDVNVQTSPEHRLSAGLELHRLQTGIGFTIAGDRNLQEANGSSLFGGSGLPDELQSSLEGTRGGLWVQETYTPSPRVSVEPGLRVDWSTVNGGATVSPRMAASYALGGGARLRAAAGLYTQSPGYEKLVQSDYFIDLSGARELELRHEKATHLIVGVEQALGVDATVRVEGYYKRFGRLLIGRLETETERLGRIAQYDFPTALADSVPTAPLITSNPTNDAGGDAYGFDVYLNHSNPAAPLTGWVTYAWGRANRESYGRRYAFEYDRRHAFNAVGRYRLTTRWDLAATARVASGFPYTAPIGLRVSGVEDDRGQLVPGTDGEGNLIYAVDHGGVDNLNAGRLPYYARVDLRATYRRGGATGRWSFYIEIINLLGRENPVELESRLAHDPSSDMPRLVEVAAQGFPRIPTFGFRLRF